MMAPNLQTADVRAHSMLVVEDSDDDYEALQRSCAGITHAPQLERAGTAEEALDALERGLAAKPRTVPTMILLDLNLPGMDGRELLEIIKAHPLLQAIPVVVLTTSRNTNDVDRCYRSRVNAYHTKTMGVTSLRQQTTQLMTYWFEHAVLPSRVEPA